MLSHQLHFKNSVLGFIDESGFCHDMPRTHGYSAIGERCYGIQDWGSKGRTNVIGALIERHLFAVTLFNCNIDADVFYGWVENSLIPDLPNNSIVVMDNASFHKRKDIQHSIINAGHTLEYSPPYSPDLNPIEHQWANKKRKRRKELCSINDLFI